MRPVTWARRPSYTIQFQKFIHEGAGRNLSLTEFLLCGRCSTFMSSFNKTLYKTIQNNSEKSRLWNWLCRIKPPTLSRTVFEMLGKVVISSPFSFLTCETVGNNPCLIRLVYVNELVRVKHCDELLCTARTHKCQLFVNSYESAMSVRF